MKPFYKIFIRAGGWISIFVVWAGFSMISWGISLQINSSKLAQASEPTLATIIRKDAQEASRNSRDGISMGTKFYIEYAINIKGEVYSNNYRVDRTYFNSVNEGDVVQARYLAGNPEVNELLEGQMAEAGIGTTVVGGALSVLGLLLALGFAFTTRKAVQVLQKGKTTQATVQNVYSIAMFSRVRYAFKAPNGAVLARKTFWRFKRHHRGLKRRDKIEIKYDPTRIAYSFWQGDLEGPK